MAKPFKTAAKSTTKRPLSTGKKRLILVGASLVIVLAAGGLTSWWLVAHKEPETAKLTPKDTPQDAQQQASGLVEKGAQGNVTKESLDQTTKQLSDLEEDAKSPEVKQVYGGAIVDLYQQNDNLPAALEEATEDNDDYGTAYTAAHLAGVYEIMEDYANAAKYYKQAVERSPKTGPTERSAYNDYRLKQEEMEQKH